MDLFQQFYDTDGDGRLTGFERVRYEDNNLAYLGSLVPDLINERYERHMAEYAESREDPASLWAAGLGDDDYVPGRLWYEDDDDEPDDDDDDEDEEDDW